MTRYARHIAFTLLLGLVVVPAAQASSLASVQIGISGPVVVSPAPAAAPYPGSYWRPGHYEWTRFGYRWVPGHWVTSRHARRGWSRDRWERRDWQHDGYPARRDWNRDDRWYRR